jgi:hypothetical protein
LSFNERTLRKAKEIALERFHSKFASIPKIAAATAALLLHACAGIPPPLEEIASADATVNLATQAGARDHAPLELKSAHLKLRQARAAMAEEDYVTARRLAEQAQVEAELAQAKSQSAVAQQSVMQVRESIRVLREEVGGSTATQTAPP